MSKVSNNEYSALESKLNYNTTERAVHPESRYKIVNIYSVERDSPVEEKIDLCKYIRMCLCCHKANAVAPMDDPNSSLVGRIGRSYSLNSSKRSQRNIETPVITITRTFDEDSIKSTTKLLPDKNATDEPNFQRITLKRKASSSSDKTDSGNNSGSSTLRTGEKSFIRDILACRDTFLKSLEWCDNSLTRNKKRRHIKRDEWVEMKTGRL